MRVLEELRRIERDILPAPWATARGSFNTLVLSVGRLMIASLGWNTREEDAKHARAIVAMRNSHPALLQVAEAARDVGGDYAEHEGPQTPAFARLRAALAELEQVQL